MAAGQARAWGARLKTALTDGGGSVMRLGCAVENRAYRWRRVSHAPGMRGWKPRLPVAASQSCAWDARLETAPTDGGGQAFASCLLVTLCFVRLRPLVFQFGNARCLFGIPRF